VSSVNMTAQVGYNLSKGDEFGYFLFGGSDIIVLYQRGKVEHIEDDAKYRRCGESIAALIKGGHRQRQGGRHHHTPCSSSEHDDDK
jgi:hypothetical protein